MQRLGVGNGLVEQSHRPVGVTEERVRAPETREPDHDAHRMLRRPPQVERGFEQRERFLGPPLVEQSLGRVVHRRGLTDHVAGDAPGRSGPVEQCERLAQPAFTQGEDAEIAQLVGQANLVVELFVERERTARGTRAVADRPGRRGTARAGAARARAPAGRGRVSASARSIGAPSRGPRAHAPGGTSPIRTRRTARRATATASRVASRLRRD